MLSQLSSSMSLYNRLLHFFLPVKTVSPLIKILKEFTENKKESKDVRDIRTLLISNELLLIHVLPVNGLPLLHLTSVSLWLHLENVIGTGISMSKHYNFTNFCYLCNSNKSHTNQNVIIQQPLITSICVNRFHQSRTGRLSKNTAHILCNRSISLTSIDGSHFA